MDYSAIESGEESVEQGDAGQHALSRQGAGEARYARILLNTSRSTWAFGRHLFHGTMSDPHVRLLGPDDLSALREIAAGVFDHAVSARWSAEFFADPRHHLAVALENSVVVGMASAVHYVHPDKPPQLWINEIGVAPPYHGRGIGRHLLERLLRLGTELECTEAWVLTDRTNVAAQRLYESVGGLVPAEECIMYTIPIPLGRVS